MMDIETTQSNEDQDYEIDEDFAIALTRCEDLGMQYEHTIRLTLKHCMCSARHVLQKSCGSNSLLQNTWFEYLRSCECFDAAQQFSESHSDWSSYLGCFRLTNSSRDQQNELFREDILKFMNEEPTKWTNKKRLDKTASIEMTLDQRQKETLAELAYEHLNHHDIQSAFSLTFCLNEPDMIIDKYIARYGHVIAFDELSRSGCRSNAASSMLRLGDSAPSDQLYKALSSACSTLGLLDETIVIIIANSTDLEVCMSQTLAQVEMVADSNLDDKLESIDPVIRRPTLESLSQVLKHENNKNLNAIVITLLLQALKIFLMKSTSDGTILNHVSLPQLESMFGYLSAYLKELELGESDGLVRATNSFVVIIKEKLDALSDNEVIRESFKRLVDTVAGQCLIETRYKSAAMLYSQIGDNKNAVKSLMRTGEVQTVVDYALLVRDVTVNRITINFMRHLKVDSSIIDSFLARTRP